MVLKGGTALNVFRFDVPRLSVDIDLNYIGSVDRDGVLADRPKIVTVDVAEADTTLIPLLRGKDTPHRNDLSQWTKTLVADCHELLAMVLPLTDREREFLERLNGKGEILPEVLTADERLREIVRTHPRLLWKALNVQKFRGTSTHGTSPESDRYPIPRASLHPRMSRDIRQRRGILDGFYRNFSR